MNYWSKRLFCLAIQSSSLKAYETSNKVDSILKTMKFKFQMNICIIIWPQNVKLNYSAELIFFMHEINEQKHFFVFIPAPTGICRNFFFMLDKTFFRNFMRGNEVWFESWVRISVKVWAWHLVIFYEGS